MTYIIIPAYNEENSIGDVIDSLREHNYNNIVVVDDGSKDNTYKIAKEKKVHALRHIINRGQGAALQTATDYALLQGANIIVHFDADGQHNPKQIENLTTPIINNEAQATLGSRFLSKQHLPRDRKIILQGAKLIIRLMYGIKLTDVHNGFRAFSREAIKKIKIRGDGMEHASEILEQIKKKNIKYKEVPVIIRYTEETLKKGQKNSNSIKILLKMIYSKFGG
ncbi:glycosyltransferase family 2 protein [Candidatus Woesearchaeota archaeon]|jgi:polyprenyl-phospho-N-acetylgalactosaminyl synthase|nr:glycosyltransferase family 2 protein [Candidatus Woesearchaeota archaeon]